MSFQLQIGPTSKIHLLRFYYFNIPVFYWIPKINIFCSGFAFGSNKKNPDVFFNRNPQKIHCMYKASLWVGKPMK